MAEPILVPLAEKATLVTVPFVRLAVAEIVCEVLTVSVEPLAGVSMTTTGAVKPPPPPPPPPPAAVTVMATDEEVA